MLSSTLGRRKVGETFPKSAGCTLEEQKRPKVLPKGFGASLKCIVPLKFNIAMRRVTQYRLAFNQSVGHMTLQICKIIYLVMIKKYP